MNLQPVDYMTGLGPLPDPLRDLNQQVMRQLGQQRIQLENQQIGLENQGRIDEAAEAQSFRDDLVKHYGSNPTREGMAYMLARYGKAAEGLKTSYETLDARLKQQRLSSLAQMEAAARNKRPDLFRRMAREHFESEKQAGTVDESDHLFMEMIESEDPADWETAASLIRFQLASTEGADKLADAITGLEKSETEAALKAPTIAKAEAEATIAGAEARYREPKLEAEIGNTQAETQVKFATIENIGSMITDRAARLDLDRDRLESSVQLELQKLEQSSERLTPGMEKEVTERVVAAESARALAGKASELARRFDTTEGSAGLFARFGDWTGLNSQEAVKLRREYTAIINNQAIKGLPPGAASDSDVKMALAGFPPPSARPSTVAAFLRGMAKLQEFAANSEQSKADWIAGNGNIGPARRDLWVNGTRVPAGTTYGEFSKTLSRFERRDKPQERSYWRYGDGSLLRRQ
jgi:hypothetical protein